MTRKPSPWWTLAEDAWLRRLHAEGKSDPDIAYILGRHRRTIRRHRIRLGLPPAPMRFARGWSHTSATLEAMAVATKAHWQNPVTRAAMAAGQIAATARSRELRWRQPPRGTPEFAQYRKLRTNLGPAEAKRAMGYAQ